MRRKILRLMLQRRDRPFLPAWVQRLDEAGLARLAAMPASPLDQILPRLTRAANGGRLWMGVAAALAATGGPKNRRAAVRGMTALSVTSFVVNVAVKMAARRHRPDPVAIPLLRRLAHAPISSSFPSGHTASAAAFAVAASLESPRLAAPLGTLATGVGVSRVYNGAHYPSDVVVGAAIGAGIAIAAKKIRPTHTAVFDIETTLSRVRLKPAENGEGLIVLTNDSAGNGSGAASEVGGALPSAIVRPLDGTDLGDALEGAAAEGARALGIAGGDGSINAAACVALDHELPLAIVPAGTLNHLARDLGIDSASQTADAVNHGEAATIDVGLIDGKPFLNTASFGAYARIVAARERLEDRLGKWPAAAVALARELRKSKPTIVEIDGKRRRLWAIFIGNCRYEPSGFAPTRRPSLDDGVFDVRMLLAERPWSRASIIAAAASGDLRRSRSYQERRASRLRFASEGEPLQIARDGEVGDASHEFVVEKSPRKLAVFVPDPSR